MLSIEVSWIWSCGKGRTIEEDLVAVRSSYPTSDLQPESLLQDDDIPCNDAVHVREVKEHPIRSAFSGSTFNLRPENSYQNQEIKSLRRHSGAAFAIGPKGIDLLVRLRVGLVLISIAMTWRSRDTIKRLSTRHCNGDRKAPIYLYYVASHNCR
jgi:hypothetical protein